MPSRLCYTDAQMDFPLISLFLLLAVSAFFSCSETAFFSLNNVGLRELETRFPRAARRINFLLERPTRLVATCLIGNECANVLLSNILASFYHRHLPSLGLITVVNLLTAVPLIVIIGEITPKIIGAKQSVTIAKLTSGPVWFCYRLFFPIRWFIEVSVNSLTRILGIKQQNLTEIDEDDFLSMLEDSSQHGAIGESEKELIENIFELDDDKVEDIAEPIGSIFSVHREDLIRNVIPQIQGQGISRIPVLGDFPSEVVGVLYAKDLLIHAHREDNDLKVSQLMKEPLFVTPSMPLEKVFRKMRQMRVHIAFLSKEEKTVSAIVTMEDVLDHIFGEIWEPNSQEKA